jgi:DNA-directed RNA polymerase subunit K/omega
MDDNSEVTEPVVDSVESDAAPAPRPKAPPIESRFLYVDVAARRAKQLRRGALSRLDEEEANQKTAGREPFKAERVAMEEVRRHLVLYDVPPSLEQIKDSDSES